MQLDIIEMCKDNENLNWIKEKHAESVYYALSEKQKNMTSLEEITFRELNKADYVSNNQQILLGYIHTELICFLWYEIIYSKFTNKNMGYILDIYVEKKYRRNGYGKELLLKLKEILAQKGINRIDLSVAKSNEAKKLYESIGFEETMIKMSWII
jgi:ribosomal protein S18 acetylase RimI-like enzyme